ncbi:ATP-binding protein [Methylobacterium oryzae CBMB20]
MEVLGNLLDNARKWAHRRVRVSGEAAPGELRLTVEDDGPGMSLGGHRRHRPRPALGREPAGHRLRHRHRPRRGRGRGRAARLRALGDGWVAGGPALDGRIGRHPMQRPSPSS